MRLATAVLQIMAAPSSSSSLANVASSAASSTPSIATTAAVTPPHGSTVLMQQAQLAQRRVGAGDESAASTTSGGSIARAPSPSVSAASMPNAAVMRVLTEGATRFLLHQFCEASNSGRAATLKNLLFCRICARRSRAYRRPSLKRI